MSVCLSMCLCVRLFTFEVLFKHLFAPTSQSRMAKIFRDSEYLGKWKEWKEVVSDLNILFGSGLKLPRKKIVFFADFAVQNMLKTTLPDG